MKIKPKQYAQGLLESVKDQSNAEAKNTVAKFIEVLSANNQKSQIEKIIKYFLILWNREKNIVEAEITSANKLDYKTLLVLEKFIQSRTPQNCQIELRENIDHNLQGGFVIKMGDEILNASLSGRIRELKKNLI